MKIFLVIFIAAVASASRPPRGFDIDYSDSPSFFDSPPPPQPPSSRLSFLSPFSSRHESYPRTEVQSFSEDTSIINDESPTSYREEKIIYGSSPPSSYYPRKLHNFYKAAPSSFSQGLSFADEYRGPPPPAPNEDPRKQTSVTRDERPNASLLQFQTTMLDEQEHYKSAEQPIRMDLPTRQPLSFGGHSNHLSYGDHGLGFASVAGATAAHLDPLAIAEMTATTTTTPNPSSPSEVQVSQQQPATNTPTPTETPESAGLKATATATQPSTTISPSLTSDSESTASSSTTTAGMTSVTPKTHLELARNSPGQTTGAVSMMLQQQPRTSFEFRAVTQELPPAAHGQLPLEAPRQEQPSHVHDIKQNLLQQENKANFPYQQFDYQFHQQNNNNAAPLRFTIPTATISAAPLSAASPAVLQTNPNVQGLSHPQAQFALAAGSNGNSYSVGHNQIDISQLGNYNSINTAPQLPSYYYTQNSEQARAVPQNSASVPLASFYMVPNNVQTRQQVQINSGVPSGIPLQLNGFGGIELLTSSSNSEPIRHDILGLGRSGYSIQGQLQSPESPFARIGFGQNFW